MVDSNDLMFTEDLTPKELNRSELPDQTAYKISMEDCETFEIDSVQASLPVFTNEIKVTTWEGEPGDMIDWHTHTPNLDQINICLDGRVKFWVEQDEEEVQEVEIGPREIVYVPAGARHKLQVVGDEYHKALSIYRHDHVPRLEMLQPGWDTYDMGEWPIGLWVDKMRNEVVAKNENAVDP